MWIVELAEGLESEMTRSVGIGRQIKGMSLPQQFHVCVTGEVILSRTLQQLRNVSSEEWFLSNDTFIQLTILVAKCYEM